MPTDAALIDETGQRPDPTERSFLSYIEGYDAFGAMAGAAITGGAPLAGPETTSMRPSPSPGTSPPRGATAGRSRCGR